MVLPVPDRPLVGPVDVHLLRDFGGQVVSAHDPPDGHAVPPDTGPGTCELPQLLRRAFVRLAFSIIWFTVSCFTLVDLSFLRRSRRLSRSRHRRALASHTPICRHTSDQRSSRPRSSCARRPCDGKYPCSHSRIFFLLIHFLQPFLLCFVYTRSAGTGINNAVD